MRVDIPYDMIGYVFSFLTSDRDRNAVSQVCQLWKSIDENSRQKVSIGNCYSITPEKVVKRFPGLKSITLKGKPPFEEFHLTPHYWGGFVYPWIKAFAREGVKLEELRLKRMIVSDQDLQLLSKSFANLKSLVLICCEGFTTDGLAAVVANCRSLRELDLQKNIVDESKGQWLHCFPNSSTSLVSLNFASLDGEVNLAELERLVARSPNLRSLRLNRAVPIDVLTRILIRAPNLVDLGVGSCVPDADTYYQLANTMLTCNSVRSLSGFLQVGPQSLLAFHIICPNLTSLDLRSATEIHREELILLIGHCKKLQQLWVLDSLGDEGLEVVAYTCKDLQELRVFSSDPLISAVTEEGLVAISSGCPKLQIILYYCQQMTNAALITVAKNNPNLTCFQLTMLDLFQSDALTQRPLDEGFGAIVESCKSLKRLSLAGLLTDRVFLYIGMYAEQLERLSMSFAGNFDKGIKYVLNGCKKLRQLETIDTIFGNAALLKNVKKYTRMRSLWMLSCKVTLGACKTVAKKMPQLNVEIINWYDKSLIVASDSEEVENLYIYRTLVGRRRDAPNYVWKL